MTTAHMESSIESTGATACENPSRPDATAPMPGPAFIQDLLSEQQQLTAVEQFSRFHAASAEDSESGQYSALLPASPLEPGEQYAFEVDLDRCSGCKACVTACHSLNGLDEDETWRDVGLLQGGTSELPVLQHVTTACHHCLEPACMTACPVDAYEKDPVTGIVKHLDDQCFGCQYCTLACPYDVPKYHKQKGIVRKCDMCSDRLAVGEAPACAQACPQEAITIRKVNRQQVIDESETGQFLPGAPDPHITLPTTTFKTARVLPRNMMPVDYFAVRREHAHWPLVLMLVFTQLSVGAFLVEFALERFLRPELISMIRPAHSMGALFFGLSALAASTFHLGRPHLAYRAIVGLRHSWLSREIVAFGAFAAAGVLYAGASWSIGAVEVRPLWFKALGASVGIAGIAGVFCSIMIYHFTRRELWSGTHTAIRFLLTTALLGVASYWLTLMLLALAGGSDSARLVIEEYGASLCKIQIAIASAKLVFEASLLRHLKSRQNTPLKRSALLMTGELSQFALARFACGLLGGILMPGFLLLHAGEPVSDGEMFLAITSTMMITSCLIGETLERYLFFATVAAPRMPGGVGS